MKRFTFIFKSFVGRLVLFLSTFAVGVAMSAFLLLEKSSSIVSPEQSIQQPTQTFKKQTTETIPFEFKEPDNQILPNIVQSLIVNFPVNGRVIVQSVEEVGKFPQMVFISEKTGKVLLRSSIEDDDKWLIPEKDGLG